MSDTRVIGLVSFWDESPTWLAATLASMARFCSHVVVLDGRYAQYPDSRLQSGSAEHYAVIDAARGAGLGVTLHTAPRTYVTEMEKRTKLFQLGGLEARPGKDWFFILDGDELVAESCAKDELLARLDKAAADGVRVCTARLWEKTDSHSDEQRVELSLKLPVEWRYECSTPRFWLAHTNMRVVGYHYNYLGEDENGDTVELWGLDGVVKNRAPWKSFVNHVTIENRNRLRGILRDQDRQAYYNLRDESGIEDAKPLSVYERTSVGV